MIILPFIVVLGIVGIVYSTRRRRIRASSGGHDVVGGDVAPSVTPIGRWSLCVLGVAAVLWVLTRTTLPIYSVAALGGVSFVLAVVAAVRSRDRSPLLLLPLLLVPLAAAAGAAFALLQ